MVDPPRRLPRTEAERLSAVVSRVAPGSAAGQTLSAKPPPVNTRAAARTVSGISGAQSDPVVIGKGASASSAGQVAVGASAEASGGISVAVGYLSTASGSDGVAVGPAATASGPAASSLGQSSIASGTFATAVGADSDAPGDYSTALGVGALAAGQGAVAIGMDSSLNSAIAPNDNDFVLGTALHLVSIPGAFGLGSATPVGPQTTPATLADVIALLQAFGLSL